MWSRLTEVAEGLADIVAPVEGSNVEAEQQGELWGRFSAAVAPPASSDGHSVGSNVEENTANVTDAAAAALLEEDEQEQYICELERALLQRKKQNEALAAQLRERGPDAQAERLLQVQLRDKDAEVVRLQARVERLQLGRRETPPSSSEPSEKDAQSALEDKVSALETQLADQQAKCRALQTAMEHQQTANGSAGVVSDDETGDSPSTDGKSSAMWPLLVQTARTLASATASERVDGAETPADVALQLPELAKQATARLETLQSSVTRFLAQHRDVDDADADVASLEAQLDVLSQRLRDRLRADRDEDDQQLKKTLQLQAQVRSLQAAKQHGEQHTQRLAASEAALALQAEEKDAVIARLQASTTRLERERQDAQAEAAELARRSEQQEQQVETLQRRVQELLAANETLREDESELRARAGEYEQAYVALLAEMERLKTQNQQETAALLATSEEHASSLDSQRVYDLQARLATAEADRVVAHEDAARLQRSLDALEGVLHQFQVDGKLQKQRLATAEAELQQVRLELHQRRVDERKGHAGDDDVQRVVAKLASKTHECDQLREALESAATQYHSERDVLDKRLAAQLVVAYVDSDKKGEVLQLMARMMGFTEEQKRRVGLGYAVEGNGGGGLFSSLLGLVAPGQGGDGASPRAVDPATLEGKSFADIWSDFLLQEASKRGQ